MNKPRQIVITSDVFPDIEVEREVLASLDVVVVKRPCWHEDEIIAVGKEASALVVGDEPISARVLAHLPRCLVIVKPAVGVDNIDIAAATEQGICVANVPDYGADEVATHAMALLLNAIRYVDAIAADVRRGVWRPMPPYPIQRSAGRTLGIVGFGRIGRSVARKASGFGWRVLVFDPYIEPEENGVEAVDLDTILTQSDFITLHTPLTDETRGLIDATALGKMKSSAFLVNTARGGIVDSTALYTAVEEGQIAGAALDVVDAEPPPPDHPLYRSERILVTAHVAWYSQQAFEDLRMKTVQEVARVLRGHLPHNLLNPAVDSRGLTAASHTFSQK